MGYKYEVHKWEKFDDYGWSYCKVYEGEFFLKAIYVMISAKLNGVGCIKFEWR